MASAPPSYENSILETIAKLITGEEHGDYFNPDLIVAINTALAALTQLGVGASEGFSISGKDETWGDFLGTDKRLSMVITYVNLKVKMIFDPPTSSAVLEATKELIQEMEWRSFAVPDAEGTVGSG